MLNKIVIKMTNFNYNVSEKKKQKMMFKLINPQKSLILSSIYLGMQHYNILIALIVLNFLKQSLLILIIRLSSVYYKVFQQMYIYIKLTIST